MKFVCVVNPVSGKGKAIPMASHLSERLEAAGNQVRTLLTTRDMAAFGRLCGGIEADERVICIGGDGTLLYFLNHARRYRDVAFYGMGTANVVTIEYGIPRDPDGFVDMLLDGHTTLVRPGELDDGTRFLMMASLGLDAYILSKVSQRLKNRIGKAAFIPPTLAALFRYRFPRVNLILDGSRHVRLAFAVISRFKHYGGEHTIAPHADPAGETFQIIGIESGGLRRALHFMWHWLRDDLAGQAHFFQDSAREVVVSGEIPTQLDGDYFPKGFKSAKVCGQGFQLVIPKPED